MQVSIGVVWLCAKQAARLVLLIHDEFLLEVAGG